MTKDELRNQITRVFIDAYKAETPNTYPSGISLFGFVAGVDAVAAFVKELLPDPVDETGP